MNHSARTPFTILSLSNALSVRGVLTLVIRANLAPQEAFAYGPIPKWNWTKRKGMLIDCKGAWGKFVWVCVEAHVLAEFGLASLDRGQCALQM